MKTKKVIELPVSRISELAKIISCQSIAVSGKLLGVETIEGMQVAITSGAGDGTGYGWSELHGYQVVPLKSYQAKLTPLPYVKHWGDVEKGNRKRCYTGMMVALGREKVVLAGTELVFVPCQKGEQMSLSF